MLHTSTPDGVQLRDFPAVERYFPNCFYAAVEAVSRHALGAPPFSRLYGNHTFCYTRPPGPLKLKANGTELDVEFHRTPTQPGYLDEKLRQLYGISIEESSFRSFPVYWEHCVEQLNSGHAPIIFFNLGFVEARREYGKIFGPHFVVVYGFDPGRRVILAAEQILGKIEITFHDFQACFDFNVRQSGEQRVYSPARIAGAQQSTLEAVTIQCAPKSTRSATTRVLPSPERRLPSLGGT